MEQFNRSEKRDIKFGRGFSTKRHRHQVRFAAGIELELRLAWREQCRQTKTDEDQDSSFLHSTCGEYEYNVLLPDDGFDH